MAIGVTLSDARHSGNTGCTTKRRIVQFSTLARQVEDDLAIRGGAGLLEQRSALGYHALASFVARRSRRGRGGLLGGRRGPRYPCGKSGRRAAGQHGAPVEEGGWAGQQAADEHAEHLVWLSRQGGDACRNATCL